MYGYLIHGAAMVARFERKRFGNMNWVNRWKPMIDLMVRNIDDWNKNCLSTPIDGNTPCFPFLRFFDPYAGHSWAHNYTESQESISEAVQFAAATALWGDVTGNTAMRDMGIMMFVHESECGRQYWYDVQNTNVNRAPFAPDYPYNHAGIIYSWGAKYGTFFGTQPYQIHGITYWAISGSSVWMGKDVTGLQRDYTDFTTAYGGNVNGTSAEGYWSTEMLSAMALFNATGARTLFNNVVLNNEAVFNVNAEMRGYRGIGYHWISTLDSVGQVDATIQANTAFYTVFRKNNCRHYMVYNAPDKPGKTVTFTNGKSFFVPSDTLMVVHDCDPPLPLTFLDFYIERVDDQMTGVYWKTTFIESTVLFVIEKSNNGLDFQPVDTIPSRINSAGFLYSYFDAATTEGPVYYRIKQIEEQGVFSYSEMRSLFDKKIKDYGFVKKLFFYPEQEEALIIQNTRGVEIEAELVLSDLTGKQVVTIRKQLKPFERHIFYRQDFLTGDGFLLVQSLTSGVHLK